MHSASFDPAVEKRIKGPFKRLDINLSYIVGSGRGSFDRIITRSAHLAGGMLVHELPVLVVIVTGMRLQWL